MKRLILGGICLLAGIILYGFTLVAASVYTLVADGYSINSGRFGSALSEMGIIPLVISGVLVITGIYFTFSSNEELMAKTKEYFVRF